MRATVKIHAIFAILVAASMVMVGGCAKKRVAPSIADPAPPAKVIAPAPPPSPTISLTASPSTVNKGESTILIWLAEHATSVTIDGGIGQVTVSGKQSITPSASTTYTASAEGLGGNATASTRITVIEKAAMMLAPPPISDAEFFSARIGDIFFDFDQYSLSDDAIAVLNKNGAALNERPAIRFIIEGHCDERGSDKYNLALGDRRAQTVRQYLISNGISMDRIDTISYGEERPFVQGQNEEAWSKNRRAHFVMK
jgi:peptidoglycan-associated lipoprotein